MAKGRRKLLLSPACNSYYSQDTSDVAFDCQTEFRLSDRIKMSPVREQTHPT